MSHCGARASSSRAAVPFSRQTISNCPFSYFRRNTSTRFAKSRLSSTSNMRTRPGSVIGSVRYGEIELRPFSHDGIHPDAASVFLNDLLDDCQPRTGSPEVFSSMESLKYDKYLVILLT